MNGISIEPVCPVTSSSPRNSRAEWKSCCYTIHPTSTKYFIQVAILASLIVYSATMLIVDNRCESQRNYGSLLMVCLGVFLPQPKMS